MGRRIEVWALAGFFVAAGWAIYAAAAAPLTVASRNWTFIEVTCPVSLLGRSVPIKLYWVLLLNAVTYALLGLGIELLMGLRPRTAMRLP